MRIICSVIQPQTLYPAKIKLKKKKSDFYFVMRCARVECFIRELSISQQIPAANWFMSKYQEQKCSQSSITIYLNEEALVQSLCQHVLWQSEQSSVCQLMFFQSPIHSRCFANRCRSRNEQQITGAEQCKTYFTPEKTTEKFRIHPHITTIYTLCHTHWMCCYSVMIPSGHMTPIDLGEGSSSFALLKVSSLFFLWKFFFGSCSWCDVRSKVRDVVCVQIVKPSEANL